MFSKKPGLQNAPSISSMRLSAFSMAAVTTSRRSSSSLILRAVGSGRFVSDFAAVRLVRAFSAPDPQDGGVGVEVVVAAACEILVVGPGVVVDAVLGDFEDPGRELRNEPPVVGHENQGAVVGVETGDQRLDSLEIEVVGRLVENQHVWLVDR